ncbi:MAG TPA: electron transport complex subunit RsxA [Nitrospirota bacterium]|nr:electron transport complex subunit RsxA [Nitrospirota bacterium]
MDSVIEIILILISTIFVTNFVLARFLGICPFLGVSAKIETSIGMGMAVVFVITLAALCSWLIEKFVLVPFDIVYLRTIVFILVIATLVQFVEMVIRKTSPALYNALGIFLPLITTNCAVLGVALLVVQKEMDFFPMLFFAVGASVGFTVALLLMAGIREQIIHAKIPKVLQGTPISLVTAGLMALAFLGFAGLVKI